MDVIEIASSTDINEIMILINEAVKEMNKNNISQWDEIYPNRDVLLNDIEYKSLFKYMFDGKIAGIVVLNNQGPPEYTAINWKDKDGKYLVVHRLTVHPIYQRKGIAKKLMNYCEDYAKQNKYTSIRFDVFVKNPIAVNLYKKLNYKEKGTVKFRKGDFYCFEKEIIAG